MDITIPISPEEKVLVKKAIVDLNNIRHIKYMSQAMIANTSGIKATKVRLVLQELVNEGQIVQYIATENKRLNRYYYIINDKYVPE